MCVFAKGLMLLSQPMARCQAPGVTRFVLRGCQMPSQPLCRSSFFSSAGTCCALPGAYVTRLEAELQLRSGRLGRLCAISSGLCHAGCAAHDLQQREREGWPGVIVARRPLSPPPREEAARKAQGLQSRPARPNALGLIIGGSFQIQL